MSKVVDDLATQMLYAAEVLERANARFGAHKETPWRAGELRSESKAIAYEDEHTAKMFDDLCALDGAELSDRPQYKDLARSLIRLGWHKDG